MASDRSASLEKRLTYVTLTGMFLSLLGAFSRWERLRGDQVRLQPLELVQLTLATYRLGRLVAYDKVFDTERAAFTRTVLHESGAGETVVPAGTGVREALGELICCPICAGTWISALLIYGLKVFPGPTRTLVAIMSAIGGAELLNAATEALQWTGEAARKQAGGME